MENKKITTINLLSKVCRVCKQEKRVQKFRVDKRRIDGRSVTCRQCYDDKSFNKRVRTPEQIAAQKSKLLGRTYSVDHRLAISKGLKIAAIEGRHLWVKNSVRHKDQERCQIEYNLWKSEIHKKYNGKCNLVVFSQRLHCHHIKGFHEYPELRYDVNNGELLCISCHIRHHRLEKTKQKQDVSH